MRILEALDHLGGVASVAGLPLTAAALTALIRFKKLPSRRTLGVVLSCLGVVAYAYDLYDRFARDRCFRFDGTQPLGDVQDKDFRSESVVLDGKRFIRCSFSNVTLVYNGTAPYQIAGATLSGTIVLRSDNPSIQQMILLMRANGLIAKDMTVFIPDKRSGPWRVLP